MFTDYFFPELGGIQDSVAIISQSLGQRGHQVEIHAPRYGARDYRLVGSEPAERDLGSNVRIRRRMSLSFPSSTRQSRAAVPSGASLAMLSGRARPEVIHSHSFFGMGLEALLAGAWLGIPLIGTNHTTVAGFGPHLPFKVERAIDYVMWYYNHCDHVTAPSRSVFEELGLEKLRRPHHVVSNPIDTGLFRLPVVKAGENGRKARFNLTGPTITYAGRLGPEKNIEVLLRAMAVLRDREVAAELAIAGHGSHKAALRTLAEELGIAREVRFLGTLAPIDLAELLQVSDVFAMMSTSETQSMAVLQAMASGLPVVAADSRALPEFVGPENGVLVEWRDHARLADVLAGLLASPEQRREMGRAGRGIAERYSIETVTDEWEALYRSVIHGSLGHGGSFV